jgi:hypothetical protein
MKLDYPLFFQELANIWINIISISLIQSSRKRKKPKSVEVVPQEGTGLTGAVLRSDRWRPKSQISSSEAYLKEKCLIKYLKKI